MKKKTHKTPQITGWQYRLIKDKDKHGDLLAVHEVHFNKKKPIMWTEEPVFVCGADPSEILTELTLIAYACIQPILEVKNNKLYEIKN